MPLRNSDERTSGGVVAVAPLPYSQAIRLGAMLGPQSFGSIFGLEPGSSCAIGSFLLAFGIESLEKQQVEYRRVSRLFSALIAHQVNCPACSCHGCVPGVSSHLNDDHRWSRERIADFVESIERAHPGLCPQAAAPVESASAVVREVPDFLFA